MGTPLGLVFSNVIMNELNSRRYVDNTLLLVKEKGADFVTKLLKLFRQKH